MFGKFEAQFKSWEYLSFEFRSTECPHTLTPRVSVRSADSTALTRQPPASFATPARAPACKNLCWIISSIWSTRLCLLLESTQAAASSVGRRSCPVTAFEHRPSAPLVAQLLHQAGL